MMRSMFVDVGSGYGEIAAWSARRGISVQMVGIDLKPWSARAAREATPIGVPVEWRTGDAFDERSDEPVDLVLSSLFAHHLDDAALVRYLAWMDGAASIGWVVNDLHRHELPYGVFARASRAMRLHRFVQNDGPISIARSFRKADWHRLLTEARIPPGAAAVNWWIPFRLCVSRVCAA